MPMLIATFIVIGLHVLAFILGCMIADWWDPE
jgi:multisubunit Na+/H+ antiporter MnhC subunit